MTRRRLVAMIAVTTVIVAVVATVIVIERQLSRKRLRVTTIVAGQIYRSNQPHHKDWARLKEDMGLKTVINLRTATELDYSLQIEPGELARLGITYHCIPIRNRQPTPEQLKQFMEIVTDPACQPVLFHCEIGRARTGVMAAIYRILVQSWTADAAIDEMATYYGGRPVRAEVQEYLRGIAGASPASASSAPR